MFDVYIKNYMNGSTKVAAETKMLTIPVADGAKHYINKPIVKLDWSSTGSFDFEVEPKSQFYNSFIHLRTIIRVEYDGDTIFRGRVLTIDNTLWGTRKIKCEDQYGFFRDGQHAGVADDKRAVISMSSYIRALIDEYNQQMAQEPDKMFYVGEIPGNYSASIVADQQCPDITEKFGSSSWQEIKACLDDVGSGYGGHWRVRYSGGKAYLDLLKNYFNATINAQPIELKKNLLDLSNSAEVDNIFTAVIPLGSSESTTEGNTTTTVTTTIEGYNANLHEGNYIKVPDLVNVFSAAELNAGYHTLEDYRDAIDKYGMIFKTVSFSNADSQALLWSYATDWIKNNYLGTVTDFSIKLVDFHQLSQTPTYEEHASTQKYMVGDRVRVRYPIFVNGERQMKEEIMTIKGISYDLFNPENTTLTVGIPSDLLDHEYGQKKTKAKKKGKSDNTGVPTPKGGGASPRKKVHVHKWIRDTISNNGWGGATLKSVTTYKHEDNPSLIGTYQPLPTYKIATYTGTNNKTYGVALDKAGFFVYDPSNGNKLVKWVATADKDANITIQGVTFNLNTEYEKLLELCKYDDWIEIDKDKVATLDGDILTAKTPNGVSVTILKANLHAAIKIAIANKHTYGSKELIEKHYVVINPATNAGYDFKKIAKFESSDGSTHYVVLGKVGCGVSHTGRILSKDGAGIDNWLAKTDASGKLVIGDYVYDVNKDWETIEEQIKEDKEAEIEVHADSVSLGPLGTDSEGNPVSPEIELDIKEAMAKVGRDANGDWLVKLNDTITYTDADGNQRTVSGFISAQDLNLPSIPSFQTKIAKTDILVADKAYAKELYAVEAMIGDSSAKQVIYNPDGTVKSVSFEGTQFQINARHAVMVSGAFEIDPKTGDLTIVSGGAFSIKKDNAAFGIWDKKELSAGIFTAKDASGTYTEIRGDHVRIGTDSTSDTVTQATTLYAQVVGEYEWNYDSTGRKTTPKGIKEGVGVWNTKTSRAEGIWHNGNLTGGVIVERINDNTTTTRIKGTRVILGALDDEDLDTWASDAKSGTGVFAKFLTVKKLKAQEIETILADISNATLGKVVAKGIWCKGGLSATEYIECDTIRLASGSKHGLSETFIGVQLDGPTNNKYTLKFLRADGTWYPLSPTFSRATSLSGTWSSSSDKFIVTASPQGNSYPVYVTIDKNFKPSGQSTALSVVKPSASGSAFLRIWQQTGSLSSGSRTITAYAGSTPMDSVTLTDYSDGYTAGESAGKTTGWNLARGKTSVPGVGTGTSITAKWPDNGYNSQQTKKYELHSEDDNTVVLRYVTGTDAYGQNEYATAAKIQHNKYSAGYTAGENAGYASGESAGKTTGWNLARSKTSIPGSGSGNSITPKWPDTGYGEQTSRQYILRQAGSTMNLQYVSETDEYGQNIYATVAKKSIGYTLDKGSAWGKAKLQMNVLLPNGIETGWSNVKGYQEEYSVKGADNRTYYFRASAGYWGWNTQPSVSFSSD